MDLTAFEAGIRVVRAGRLLDKAIEATASDCGLVVSGDYEVLSCLRRAHPEPLQPAVLAEQTMVTTSGMTGRLDRLEQEGLVERRQNPSDRRAVDVHLTSAGLQMTDATFEAIAGTLSGLLGSMPPSDLRAMSDALRALLAGLGDAPSPS
jgi:DNA-binding MarR family transcriptional regulator